MNNTSQHSLTITNQTKGETVKLEHQTSNDTVHSTNGSNGSNGPVPNGGSSGSNGLLVNLLEKNKMVNGVSAEDKKVVVNGSGGGGGEVFQAGIKRPASIDIDSSSDAPPASKKLALEGVVCNGVSTTTTTPGGGGGILVGGGGEVNGDVAVATAVSHPTIIPQKQIVQTSSGQHIIVQKPQAQVLQQQILTLADGKKVLVKTPVSTTTTTTAPPTESTLTVTRTPSAPAVVTTVNGLQPVVAVNGAAAAVNGSGNSQESNGQNGQMTSLVGRHPSGGATVNPVVTVNNTVIHSSSAAATVSTSPSSSLPGK